MFRRGVRQHEGHLAEADIPTLVEKAVSLFHQGDNIDRERKLRDEIVAVQREKAERESQRESQPRASVPQGAVVHCEARLRNSRIRPMTFISS